MGLGSGLIFDPDPNLNPDPINLTPTIWLSAANGGLPTSISYRRMPRVHLVSIRSGLFRVRVGLGLRARLRVAVRARGLGWG